MGADVELTPEQRDWTLQVAQLLKIKLAAPADVDDAATTADAYDAASANMIGKDELGEKNKDLKIDLKLFTSHAEALESANADFRKDWKGSKEKIKAAEDKVTEKSKLFEAKCAEVKDLLKVKNETGEALAKLKHDIGDLEDKLAAIKDKSDPMLGFVLESLEALVKWNQAHVPADAKALIEPFEKLETPKLEKEAELSTATDKVSAARKELQELKKQNIDAIRECVATCLPIIDAAANNPERGTVLAMMATYSELQKKPPASQMEAQGRIDALAAMQKELRGWMDRRAKQSLPPPRDALHLVEVAQAEHRALVKTMIDNNYTPPPPVLDFETLPELEKATMTRVWSGLLDGDGPIRMPVEADMTVIAKKLKDHFAPLPTNESDDEGSYDEPKVESQSNSDADEPFEWESEEGTEESAEEGTQTEIAALTVDETDENLEHKIEGSLEKAEEARAERLKEEEQTRKASRIIDEFKDKPENIPDAKALNDFRMEIMSTMARLMSNKSGRKILSLIDGAKREKEKDDIVGKTTTKLTLDILPGVKPMCSSQEGDDAYGTPKGGTGADMLGELDAGKGTSCWVTLPCGMKDGDILAQTKNGNPIMAPTPVLLAHELLHALHNLTGTNRGKGNNKEQERLLKDAELSEKWSNFEEYWTIMGGEISEKTVRDDYGLSAERLGHKRMDPEKSLANVATEIAQAAQEIDGIGPETVYSDLKKKGLAPEVIAGMTEVERLKKYKSK
jgi:hypothetical protein